MSEEVRGFFKVLGGLVAVSATAFLLLLWVGTGYWPIPAARGWRDARIDLSHGRYLELGWGLPPLGMDKYISLLHQKYGVDYQNIGGCTASPAQREYVAAYDSVSESAINRKFGRDIFKEVAGESFNTPKIAPAKDDETQPVH